MKRYILTPKAESGFWGIILYAEKEFGVFVAEQVAEKIESAFVFLARNQHLGHRREDLTDDRNLRFWSVGPTLIAFYPDTEPLQIIAVSRASRDWREMLTDRIQ